MTELVIEYCAPHEGSFVVCFSDIEKYNSDVSHAVNDLSSAVGVIIDQTVKRIGMRFRPKP